jgi:hypothetical protein
MTQLTRPQPQPRLAEEWVQSPANEDIRQAVTEAGALLTVAYAAGWRAEVCLPAGLWEVPPVRSPGTFPHVWLAQAWAEAVAARDS